MAKYIDADLLRKEIEKERKNIDGLFTEGDNSFYDGQDDAYNHTLALINSLQQEQPKEIDLRAEIEMEWDSFNKHLAEYNDGADEVVWLNRFSFEDIANYFCKLGRKQVLQEIYNGKVKPVDKITATWLDDKEEDK